MARAVRGHRAHFAGTACRGGRARRSTPGAGSNSVGQGRQRRRGEPDAAAAEDERPFERGRLGEAGGEPGLGLDRAASNGGLDGAWRRAAPSRPAMSVIPARPRAGSLRSASSAWMSSASVGWRRTAANANQARPTARIRSPTEMTFWMIGSGTGMMSPRGPPRSRNPGPGVSKMIVWNAEWTSAWVNPARGQGRRPDRHRSAVEQHRDQVRERPHEDQPEAGARAGSPSSRRGAARTRTRRAAGGSPRPPGRRR